MSSRKLLARKGRLRQRYDNEYRLVAGCIPYRVKKDEESNPCSLAGCAAQLEVLMISTPNRDDLVFPKGGWEDDEDVYEAACREALEEAGVKGNINRTSLGHWVFKSKSSQNSDSPRGACKGFMFALEVTEELESWPEQETHCRRWVSPGDAYQLCRYEWMREALTALLEQLSVIQPVASAADLTEPTGMCMMLQATTDRAVALC